MLTTTAKEFRPDATTSHSAEDLQPNESINKRQRAAPPTVLSASLKLPSKFNNTRWRHSSRGRGPDSGFGQHNHGIASSHSGRTQQGGRGNVPWRGTFNARAGRHGRGAGSYPTWRHPPASFHIESPQTSSSTTVPVKPPILKQDQPDESSSSLPHPLQRPMLPMAKPLAIKHNPHPQPPASSPVTSCQPGSNATYQSIPNSPAYSNAYHKPVQPPESSKPIPPLIHKRSASPPTTLVRSITPPLKRRKLDPSPVPSIVVKVEDLELTSPSDSHSHSAATSEIIKVETRSSSPPPRRLITESCSFFPLPEDCRKTSLQYVKNRRAFFTREYNVLKCLGLRRTNVIFRFARYPFPAL